MTMLQIIIDLMALIAFLVIAITDKDWGYSQAALWAFVALVSHIQIHNYEKNGGCKVIHYFHSNFDEFYEKLKEKEKEDKK